MMTETEGRNFNRAPRRHARNSQSCEGTTYILSGERHGPTRPAKSRRNTQDDATNVPSGEYSNVEVTPASANENGQSPVGSAFGRATAHGTQTRSAPLRLQFGHTSCEMIGKIEIVVIQESDISAACQRQGVIVWPGHVAATDRQIDKNYPRVVEGRNDLCGVVGTRVADDDGLPIAERRIAQAANGVPQRLASVVGRDNDRNSGRRRSRSGAHVTALRNAEFVGEC